MQGLEYRTKYNLEGHHSARKEEDTVKERIRSNENIVAKRKAKTHFRKDGRPSSGNKGLLVLGFFGLGMYAIRTLDVGLL